MPFRVIQGQRCR